MKTAKRVLLFLLITVLFLNGCESDNSKIDTLVAEPLKSLKIEFEGAYYMDLESYANEQFSLKRVTYDDKTSRRAFDCLDTDLPLIEDYVKLLCEKYSFEIVGEPYYTEKNEYYENHLEFDYVLRYIGDAHKSDSLVKGAYSKNKGDISIYGYSGYLDDNDDGTWDLSCRIDFANWLSPIDEGYRFGLSEKHEEYIGLSFGAGLNKLKNSSYETDDKRFCVKINEAMILTENGENKYSAWFEWDNDEKQKRLCIDDKFGVCILNFNLPITQPVSSGDIFTQNNIGSEKSDSYENMPEHDTMFAYLHGQEYCLPKKGMFGDMCRFNARMMYWNEDEAVAVLYFCMKFRSEPYDVEGLAAVSLSSDLRNPANADFRIKKGESVEIVGPSEFGAGYNLWTWEYVSGSEFSELQNTTNKTCKLIAKKEGIVKIKVKYEYSIEEPDVLTGIPRNVSKIKTEEFVIAIEN